MKPPQGQSWQFRDQRVPARIVHLLRDDKIFVRDLLLMFAIDSLVKPQGEEDGVGCFASNSYLAKVVKANTTYVSERLNTLKKMGLVVIITLKGRRYLELEWSRTAEEVREVAGEYGNALRKARRLLRNACSDSARAEGGGSARAEAEYSKEEDLNKTKTISRPKGGGVRSMADLDGGRDKLRSPGGRLAVHLYTKLRERRKIMSAESCPRKWGNRLDQFISQLAKRDGLPATEAAARLEKDINIHVEHLDDRYWPKAYSADTFCAKFANIEDAIARLDQQHGDDQKTTLYKAAQRAADEDGDCRVTKGGRVWIKRPGGNWTMINEGEELEYILPDDVLIYVRYVRGELPADWDPHAPPITVSVVELRPEDDI